MKKRIVAFLFFLSVLFATACFVQAAPLPDVMDEWHASPTVTTEFRTASRDFGRWQSRVYTRAAPIAAIEVSLMEGPGPGTLRVPVEQPVLNGVSLGSTSAYRVLTVAERRAVLERGEVTGQTLAVAEGENRTLTAESKSVSEQELLDFAERLLHALRQAD